MEILDKLEGAFDEWYSKGYLLIGGVVGLIVCIYLFFKIWF